MVFAVARLERTPDRFDEDISIWANSSSHRMVNVIFTSGSHTMRPTRASFRVVPNRELIGKPGHHVWSRIDIVVDDQRQIVAGCP